MLIRSLEKSHISNITKLSRFSVGNIIGSAKTKKFYQMIMVNLIENFFAYWTKVLGLNESINLTIWPFSRSKSFAQEIFIYGIAYQCRFHCYVDSDLLDKEIPVNTKFFA